MRLINSGVSKCLIFMIADLLLLLYYNGKICYRIKLIIWIYVSVVKSHQIFLFLPNTIATKDIEM